VEERTPGPVDAGYQGIVAGEPTMRLFLAISVLFVSLVFSGCAGNGELDKAVALPVHCLDKPDPGSCKARLPKFYYDYPSDTCRMFHYGGCGGNVPFETRTACEEECVAGR
jgi:hypothetical protein